jgi:hypothetical protein
MFYGEETLHYLEDLEHRHPHNGSIHHYAAGAPT